MFENDDTTIYVSEELGNLPESLAILYQQLRLSCSWLFFSQPSCLAFFFLLLFYLFIQFGTNNYAALNIIFDDFLSFESVMYFVPI